MKKIIHYLIYLFIFLLPFQTRWIYDWKYLQEFFWEYGSKSLYVTELLLGIILLLTIIYIFKNKKLSFSTNSRQYFKYLAITFSLLFLNVFLALNIGLAFYKLTWLILGLSLIFVLTFFDLKTKTVALTIILSSFFQGLLAIIQFIQQKVVANTWLGVATQNPEIAGTSVIETNLTRILRAYGTLPHPNILAGFLMISLLLIIAVFSLEKNSRKRLALSAIFIINNIALLMTASRAAIIGLLFGFLVYFILTKKIENSALKKSLHFFLSSTILILIIFTLFFPQITTTRISGEQRLETISTQERLNGYQQAWQIYKNNWFFGVGLGNYYLALTQTNPNQPAFVYQPVHNIYLLMLIEFGITGVLLSLLNLKIFWALLKNKILQFNRRPLTIATLSVIFALLIIGLLDHWLYSFYFGLMLTCLIISLLFKQLLIKN